MIERRSPVQDAPPSDANKLLPRIARQLDNVAMIVERSGVWPVVFFLAFYFSVTVFIAQRKLIWDDEFFTLYLSRLGSITEILRAMQTGADQHPPLFYYLTHQIMSVFGMSHLTLRLTAIAGYGLTCICLFYMLRQRTSVLWAVLGMMLPLVSRAYYYSSEARGYGLMLGFCALALLAWQRASSANRHSGWLFVLFGALAGAVSSHYYAVLFLIPLGIGEITKTYVLKRLDVPVWLSFCGASLPLLAFLATIRHASEYSAHFWARPAWSSQLFFYPSFLGAFINILLVGAVLYLIGMRQFSAYDKDERLGSSFPIWETVTLVSIAAIPLMAMILAKTVTKGYTERYALPALIGAILLLCQFGFLLTRRPRILPLILSSACVLYFPVQGIQMLRDQGVVFSELIDDMTLLSRHTDSPIAIAEVTVHHRVSFYAPRKLVQNLTYVSDPEASVKYIKHDTVDRGLLDLRPWFPLKVMPRDRYVAENPDFLVYGYIGPWTWLSYDLTPPDYETKLLEREHNRLLFAARRVHPEALPPRTQETNQEELFRQMSTDGPSLCTQWMPRDAFCATIERERVDALNRPPADESSENQ